MSDLTPDAVAGRCVGDLSQDEYEALEAVWPAAFAAVTELLIQIDEGQVSPATSDLDVSVYTLTRERTP